jgi:hypothetical protein
MSEDNVPTVEPPEAETAVPAPGRSRRWGIVVLASTLVVAAVSIVAFLLASPVFAASPSPAPSPSGGSTHHSCPNM